jgi:hypothetical protein
MALQQLGQRQPIAQQPDYSLAQRATDQLGQAVIGFDRPDVGFDPFPSRPGLRSSTLPSAIITSQPSARCRGRPGVVPCAQDFRCIRQSRRRRIVETGSAVRCPSSILSSGIALFSLRLTVRYYDAETRRRRRPSSALPADGAGHRGHAPAGRPARAELLACDISAASESAAPPVTPS